MIHEFAVSNYFSIYEETIFDLRIPGTAPDLPRFRRSKAKPDVRLPAVAVIMGPNGSGKTTLLRALVDVMRIASEPSLSTAPISEILPFLSKKAQNEPTSFRLEFDADWLTQGKARELFRYELSVGRKSSATSSNFILREALFHFPKGRPRRLFERGTPGEAIYVSPKFGLKQKDSRLDAVRADASVIATLAMLNVHIARQMVNGLQQGYLFSNIATHGNRQFSTETVIGWYTNDEMNRWMKRQIQRSDLAIQDVDIQIDSTKKQAFFHHHGLDGTVPLPFESSGTKRLFHLLPQIHLALATGDPAILDEIDGDLHVDIVNEIIHWFHDRETNPHNAQLLVTAHNVGVLDDLEKEELFIVEKGSDSVTRVHAAQDVSGLRRDTRLYPKYRAGVLGGIPKIG